MAIVRIGDRLHAIDNACPHLGAPLSAGKVVDGEIVCPLHGWRIRLADGYCRERPADCHQILRIEQEGDDILLAE